MKIKTLTKIGAPLALSFGFFVYNGTSTAHSSNNPVSLQNYAPLLSTTACQNWSVYNRDHPYTPAPRDVNQVDTYHGISVRDPFRPLEAINSPATRAWVQAQNSRLENFIAPLDDARNATISTLRNADNFARESVPLKAGKYSITEYHDGTVQQNRLLIRDQPGGKPRILLDVDALSPDHTVSLSFYHLHGNGLMAYALSAQGSDKMTLKIRDLQTGLDLPDVIRDVPHLKIMWDRDAKGLLYQAPDSADPNKMVLKHHHLGAPVDQDPVVLKADTMETPYFNFTRAGSNDFFFIDDTGTGKSEAYRRVAGDDTFKPFTGGYFDAVAQINNQVYGLLRDGDGYGRLARMDPDDSSTDWQTVIPEDKTRTVNNILFAGDRFFVLSTENMSSRLDMYSTSGDHVKTLPLPQNRTFWITGDAQAVYIHTSQLTERLGIYKYDIANDQVSLYRAPPPGIKPVDVVIERMTAVSKDGTSIPYTVVRAPTTKLNGTAAVNLYSYGGFQDPMFEDFEYDPLDWVRAGGIFVQAHLRGGGEFGSSWYKNGVGDKKQNSFNDLAAIA